VASGGNAVNTAVAGGILALGDYHGGAIENCMTQLIEFSKLSQEELHKTIKNCLEIKISIYGFGHKVYKEIDPRVKILLNLCYENGYTSNFIDLVINVEKLIEKIKGKKLVLNIDGLLSALLISMDFSPIIGKGFFIIGRVPGLVAHVIEEKIFEKPVRRLEENDIKYISNNDFSLNDNF
jgi:citryl-CoA lyase